ncbi:archease [Candidatus Marsarchaeota archaeon]|nr:archease [Candidatus Marsarchaeota archaeon]
MRRFRYLPHTADMEFRAYGKCFSEALENASFALLNIMVDLKRVGRDGSAEGFIAIGESARSEKDMAWFVLQDILSKVDSLHLNALRFNVTSLTGKDRIRLKGRLVFKKTGEDYSLLQVKAVTPHDLYVKRKNGMVSINVVVDV